MKSVTVFIPGKVLVSGEHSVVYGYPAVVASIDKGVTVSVSEGEGDVDLEGKIDRHNLVEKVVQSTGHKLNELSIQIHSDLPVGSGLGSSAATIAGVLKAIWDFYGQAYSKERLFEKTWELEKGVHTNSSGVDPAAVVYQGLMLYRRGEKPQRLNNIQSIDAVLIQSGIPEESTGEMVAKVALDFEAGVNTGTLEEIGKVTKKIINELENGGDINPLIQENGLLLEKLGVVSEVGKQLMKKLRNMGYFVKVVGAGGIKSGCGMIMICGANLLQAVQYAKSHELSFIKVRLGSL